MDAAGDCGARHRQADPPEGRPGRMPERAGGEIGGRRLLEKGCAGQEIDVRVENEDEHGRGPAQRADFRKPVVLRSPAGDVSQRGLNRTGMIEQVGVGIGENIGREGKRQCQHDFKSAPKRELAGRDKPGGGRADHGRSEADQNNQLHGGPGVARHHRRHQAVPGFQRARSRRHGDRDNRREAQKRDDPGHGLECAFAHGRMSSVSCGTAHQSGCARAALTLDLRHDTPGQNR